MSIKLCLQINYCFRHRRRRRQVIGGRSVPFFFSDDVSDNLQSVDISSFIPTEAIHDEEHCEEQGPCDPTTPYRTLSGHCNNLKRPKWGKSLTTFNRLLPSSYEDGKKHSFLFRRI